MDLPFFGAVTGRWLAEFLLIITSDSGLYSFLYSFHSVTFTRSFRETFLKNKVLSKQHFTHESHYGAGMVGKQFVTMLLLSSSFVLISTLLPIVTLDVRLTAPGFE